MLNRRSLSALVCFAAALALLVPASAQSDVFTWSGTLPNGQRLEVLDINGGIDVTPAVGNAVNVRAEKTVRRGSINDVEIKVEQESGGIVVCTLYRRSDGSFPSGCRDTNKSRGSNGKNSDVRVQYSIQMPALANLAAKTVNGAISVRGLKADVEANTVNGDVNVETAGRAQAKTVNGKVEAKIGKLDQNSTFSTVNGRIVVSMGAAVNAQVEMATVNGKIETDFPITIQGTMSRRKLQGRIGSGGPLLKLSTVNGGIRIEKAAI
ncbi:MAG: DUF4097 family beta strand repeat protein [Bryobacterales bacterium]|nr:DUF4097 family beta strand repeat protein [Bryobacterales bacterium]